MEAERGAGTWDADELAALKGAEESARQRRRELPVETSPKPLALVQALRVPVPVLGAQTAEERAAEADERAKAKEERRRHRLRDRTRAVLPPPYLAREQDLAKRVANPKAIAATWDAVHATSAVWQGAPGTGKTTLMCFALLAREGIDSSVSLDRAELEEPYYVAAWKLGRARSQYALGDGEPTIVRRALDATILLLDDLGDDEKNASSAVHDVIFDRHERGLPTWCTTAFGVDALAERYGSGIARRVFERATVIRCDP